MRISRPMNRSYLVHFLRKINAERAACARGKKGESGGEFDSLSTPPPAFPRNSRMRRKKARPLRVSFHSSGFVYPLPDKKALLARLSFVTDIPFVRGSRFHHHCCRFSSLKYYRRDYYIVAVVQTLRHYRSLFREKKREELRKKNAARFRRENGCEERSAVHTGTGRTRMRE